MSYAREVELWDQEVDDEAARLVRDGHDPHDAMRIAKSTVRLKRRAAARDRKLQELGFQSNGEGK